MCLELAANMIYLGEKAGTIEAARAMAQNAVESGAAFQKLCEMVEAQGGDSAYLRDTARFRLSPVQGIVRAPQSGCIVRADAEQIGRASVLLGAGRETKDSAIDWRRARRSPRCTRTARRSAPRRRSACMRRSRSAQSRRPNSRWSSKESNKKKTHASFRKSVCLKIFSRELTKARAVRTCVPHKRACAHKRLRGQSRRHAAAKRPRGHPQRHAAASKPGACRSTRGAHLRPAQTSLCTQATPRTLEAGRARQATARTIAAARCRMQSRERAEARAVRTCALLKRACAHKRPRGHPQRHVAACRPGSLPKHARCAPASYSNELVHTSDPADNRGGPCPPAQPRAGPVTGSSYSTPKVSTVTFSMT